MSEPGFAPPAVPQSSPARAIRAAVETAIESLIELLDALDGDPDAEEHDLEDGFGLSERARAALAESPPGPGCPISDPTGGAGEQDDGYVPLYGMDQRLIRHLGGVCRVD